MHPGDSALLFIHLKVTSRQKAASFNGKLSLFPFR